MEASSMTLINNDKSYIFFFNTLVNVQSYLAWVLGFDIKPLPIKYLGMPLSINSLRKSY